MSGEPKRNYSVNEFSSRIKATWQKAVESIIETGRLLIEAKDKLPHGEFQKMINQQLPFGVRAAQILMAIAKHPVIGNAKHVSHLPPCWGTLYALSSIPDRDLLELIEEGRITPETTRNDVKKFGFYLFERVPAALNVLLDFSYRYPDPDDFVPDYLGSQMYDGSLSHYLTEEWRNFPEWIAKLRDAIDRSDEEWRRKMDAEDTCIHGEPRDREAVGS